MQNNNPNQTFNQNNVANVNLWRMGDPLNQNAGGGFTFTAHNWHNHIHYVNSSDHRLYPESGQSNQINTERELHGRQNNSGCSIL